MPITSPYQNGFEILAKARGQGLRQKEKVSTVSDLASGKGQKNRGAFLVCMKLQATQRQWLPFKDLKPGFTQL